MNQNQRVLNHLIDHGYITQTIASSYGIRRLASRITDLAGEGISIQREMRKDDAGVRYAYYSMHSAIRDVERNRRDEKGRPWRTQDGLTAHAA